VVEDGAWRTSPTRSPISWPVPSISWPRATSPPTVWPSGEAGAGGVADGRGANLRPTCSPAVVAEVPFVDVVSTMSGRVAAPPLVTNGRNGAIPWPTPTPTPPCAVLALRTTWRPPITRDVCHAGINDPGLVLGAGQMGGKTARRHTGDRRSVADGDGSRAPRPVGRYEGWRDEPGSKRPARRPRVPEADRAAGSARRLDRA